MHTLLVEDDKFAMVYSAGMTTCSKKQALPD